MISIEEAYRLLSEHVLPLAPRKVRLVDAVGRILVEDIAADVDSPPHKKSVMDGFAIRSKDLNSGTRKFKIIETIAAGSWPQFSVGESEAARIMTGAPLPEGTDAVVMVEKTRSDSTDGHDWVHIELDSIPSGKHAMVRASNFAKGDIVFRAGHRIRPSDIGLLAEVGAHEVATGSRPTAAFLPTGDELVTCDRQPARGQIRNSNGPMLLAMANQLGLKTADLGIGRDCKADLESAVRAGLEHDLFVLSGGVSAGLLDLVPEIMERQGVQQVFHKIKIKPGKPIWFGTLTKDNHCCCVFGLPGNPVSSLIGFHMFVRTAIRQMELDPNAQPKYVAAVLATAHETRGDRPTYWPGRCVTDDSTIRSVEPLEWHGSSDLLSLGSADGLIRFPGETKLHSAGTDVRFFPLQD